MLMCPFISMRPQQIPSSRIVSPLYETIAALSHQIHRFCDLISNRIDEYIPPQRKLFALSPPPLFTFRTHRAVSNMTEPTNIKSESNLPPASCRTEHCPLGNGGGGGTEHGYGVIGGDKARRKARSEAS